MKGVQTRSPLQLVRERIARACARAGREPAEVKLVAVSKGRSVAAIEREILAHGHTLLGENRVQEWREKAGHIKNLEAEVEWHFIGNLQTNKVKYCEGFSLIHSLNSARLADALEAFGEKRGHTFCVLLEVNVAAEASKKGAALPEALALARYVRTLKRLRLRGLMTIAPYSARPEDARPVFRSLRELRDKLELEELSMGMSGDFEVAIEEGATYVRVGASLFPHPFGNVTGAT